MTSPTKPAEQSSSPNADPRKSAALRTAIVMGLVALGIYGAFFLRAILNS